MEACETSMEKFYHGMHQLKEIQHLDILLKRMISHVRLIDEIEIETISSELCRLSMH
jgi:hypothetical protein